MRTLRRSVLLPIERALRASRWLLVLGSVTACQSNGPTERDEPGSGGSGSAPGTTAGETAKPTSNPTAGIVPSLTGGGTVDEVCEQGEAPADLVPTNLLFVVDKSGSMNCN